MKSEDEWKPAAGANAPAAGFLYDRRQSRAVVMLRSQNIFSKQAVQNAIFCRIKEGGLFKTANDAFSSEHFVNFCEKGSKKCVLAAYHMRDFFGGVRTGNAGADM